MWRYSHAVLFFLVSFFEAGKLLLIDRCEVITPLFPGRVRRRLSAGRRGVVQPCSRGRRANGPDGVWAAAQDNLKPLALRQVGREAAPRRWRRPCQLAPEKRHASVSRRRQRHNAELAQRKVPHYAATPGLRDCKVQTNSQSGSTEESLCLRRY